MSTKYLDGRKARALRRELKKLPLDNFRVRLTNDGPDAPWQHLTNVFNSKQIPDLFKKTGRFSIGIIGPFHYALSTGYSTYEIKYVSDRFRGNSLN